MPRNSAGTYTLPAGNPVVAGTTIDASWANDTMSDMANELTNSLSRTGAGGMLAPFRVADGSVTAPGLGFTNETNTGLYRAGTGELWFTVGGVAVAQITANGLLIPSGKRISLPAPVNDADAANKEYVDDLVNPVIQYANYYLGPKSSDPSVNNSGGPLTEGTTYWSTTLDQMRVYNGTNWEPMPSTASLVGQTFSGDGVDTTFTLANPSGPAINLEVFISGVRQVPTTDYSVSGTTLTFVVAPPSGTDNIFVRFAQLIALASADSSNISFLPAGTGAVTRTAQAKMRDLPSVTDFGISADGTDQTSALVTWLNSLSASTKAIYLVPYNCKFNVTTVMAAMPAGVMFLDLSGLNGYSSPGNTAKRVGIFARDTAPDDSAWQIVSGHNAGLQFNNFGTSGSTSAAERVQAIIYSSGMFASGTQGYREMAEVVLKQATGNDFWEWNWNSMAPWLAIAANYEYWATGVAATSGVTYVLSDFKIYVAASTGTTGATAPTWSSGTSSDGGVLWTFVRNTSSAILSLDEFGRIRSNAGVATTDLLSLKQSNQDPATSCVATIQAKATAGTPRFVQLVMNPTNGATPSIVEAQPAIRATAGVGLQVMKSDGSGALATFSDSGGVEVREFRSASSTAANGDTTPSVAGIGTLYVDNSSPTSITALDDGSDGQIVTVIVLANNTSFTHSSTLMLSGSVNVTTPASYSSITFQKVPSFISNRWIEIARSLK